MEKTTLILGAGFSIPYGYPSGKDLIKHIRDMNNYEGVPKINQMKQTIKYTKIRSIDTFLNEHKDFHPLGIEQIAKILYDKERTYSLRNYTEAETKEYDNSDIIELLLNAINEDDFNKFNIITFNYDRHFEWSFYMKLLYKYNGDKKKAMQALGKLKIIHVHGSMIPFTKFTIEGTELKKGQWVPYGIQTNHEDADDICSKEFYARMYLEYAQNNIKTIHTNDSMNEEIKTVLQASTRVFFLGFAFEEKNMALLGINAENVHKKVPYDWNAKTVFGTCYKMETIEINPVKRLFPFLRKNKLKNVNCRDFFLKEFSLINPLDDLTSNINPNKTSCCDMTATQLYPFYEKETDRFTRRLEFEVKCLVCDLKQVRYFAKNVDNVWSLASPS